MYACSATTSFAQRRVENPCFFATATVQIAPHHFPSANNSPSRSGSRLHHPSSSRIKQLTLPLISHMLSGISIVSSPSGFLVTLMHFFAGMKITGSSKPDMQSITFSIFSSLPSYPAPVCPQLSRYCHHTRPFLPACPNSKESVQKSEQTPGAGFSCLSTSQLLHALLHGLHNIVHILYRCFSPNRDPQSAFRFFLCVSHCPKHMRSPKTSFMASRTG